MVDQFEMRKNVMGERLKNIPYLSFVQPGGAFYIYINISKTGMNANEAALHILNECKVAVVPWDDEHIRVSYANSLENIEEGMERLKEWVFAL